MERPPTGTLLGRITDLPDPGGREADWEGEAPLFLVRKGDEIRCYVNICPHAGRALSLPDGRVFLTRDEDIICPIHGATFDVLTGSCTGGPAGDPLTAVAIRIDGDEIRVA
ncbi:Rieske (2Fe-2S) protein [Hyphobacterium sp. HN65]|uniref:Rieske (2Fe-2S) protein n=1 Tax=Hyphobacterium lacteum TaxID=3116575 RepID=A0ABU7LRP3_9PROT|nr:Rieske (2Fe-2S) protein [Hyphobacterium sp. HN65]MEE2526580.1 Rieske (2Fe-2S) protein [Hyphobacterium sp. HN65]